MSATFAVACEGLDCRAALCLLTGSDISKSRDSGDHAIGFGETSELTKDEDRNLMVTYRT